MVNWVSNELEERTNLVSQLDYVMRAEEEARREKQWGLVSLFRFLADSFADRLEKLIGSDT